jgi:hypothetical protein
MKKRHASFHIAHVLIIIFLTGCGNSTQPTVTSSATPETTVGATSSSELAKDTTTQSSAPTTTAQSTRIESTRPESLPENTPDSIVTFSGTVIELSSLSHYTTEKDAPVVYYISDISPEAMVEIYEALEWSPTGKVAVKLSTGEPPASNYLSPDLIKNVVELVDGTIVECNTAYAGNRASTKMHYQVAEDHGFTAIADFQIQDEDGSMTLTVSDGKRLTENYVGAAFSDYDSYLVLSHFKGHEMAGYGGAIKNISIGLASAEGKAWIHSGGKSKTSMWGGNQDAFLESMADAAKSVSDYLGNGERIVYISVMNRLSIDCDCNGHPDKPDIHDIGILASTDPVALDQACIDLIYVSEGNKSFIKRLENLNGIHTIESAEAIGLGRREYKLIDLDEE